MDVSQAEQRGGCTDTFRIFRLEDGATADEAGDALVRLFSSPVGTNKMAKAAMNLRAKSTAYGGFQLSQTPPGETAEAPIVDFDPGMDAFFSFAQSRMIATVAVEGDEVDATPLEQVIIGQAAPPFTSVCSPRRRMRRFSLEAGTCRPGVGRSWSQFRVVAVGEAFRTGDRELLGRAGNRASKEESHVIIMLRVGHQPLDDQVGHFLHPSVPGRRVA